VEHHTGACEKPAAAPVAAMVAQDCGDDGHAKAPGARQS